MSHDAVLLNGGTSSDNVVVKFAFKARESLKWRGQRAVYRLRERYHRQVLRAPDFPQIIHIENTSACGAKCVMCPREQLTRPFGVMDFELFKRLIDECSQKWQVRELHLHGFGEALLEKSFARKVAYAKSKGIKDTYVVTTGAPMKEEVSRELVLAGLDRVKFSFYGATKQTYEKVHVNLNFDEVVGNIRQLLAVRKALGRRNPAVTLQFLPQPDNGYETEEFVALWRDHVDRSAGDRLVASQLHNYGGGRSYVDVEGRSMQSCILPFTTMQITWDGRVISCCYDFNAEFVLDNIFDRSIEEAWNNEMFRRLRDAHRRRDLKEFPFCDKCDVIRQ